MNRLVKAIWVLFALSMIISSIVACATPQPTATPKPQPAPAVAQPTAVPPTAAAQTGTKPTAQPAVQGEPKDFDDWVHPRVKTDGKLTLAFIHGVPSGESVFRTVQQTQIECAHRGWEYVDIVNKDNNVIRENILNAINQDVDVIIMGNASNMESYTDVLQQAREQGIGVYNNDSQLVPGVICNSTMPGGVAAMELIYYIGIRHNWTANIAFINYPPLQVSNERIPVMITLMKAFPNMQTLTLEDVSTNPSGHLVASYQAAKAWVEKYGDKMDGIITWGDSTAMAAVEGLIAAGDPNGEKYFVAAMDGGSQPWGYIRNGSPFQYDYTQPFELYTHKLFEVINQLQVLGLNPGDQGCDIPYSGFTIWSTGFVVDRNNVPAVGQKIHSVYPYYDPNCTDCWYNWTDAPGPYMIVPGVRKEIPLPTPKP